MIGRYFIKRSGIAHLLALRLLRSCGIGSALGVGIAGQAAAGVVSEDPNKFFKSTCVAGASRYTGYLWSSYRFHCYGKIGLLGGDVCWILL